MLIVTARLNPVLILLVSLVRVSLTFLGGAARTSFLEYIYFLETTSFTCFSTFSLAAQVNLHLSTSILSTTPLNHHPHIST